MVNLSELEENFFGLILHGSQDDETKKVEYKSERPFHITMASLDPLVESDNYVPVKIQKGDKKFLICTLSKTSNILQQSLALEMNAGETVTFYLDSKLGTIHLTGYFINDECSHGSHDNGNIQLLDPNYAGMIGENDDSDDDNLDDDDEDEDDDDDEDEDDDDEEEDDDEDDEEDDDEDEDKNKRKNNSKDTNLQKKSKTEESVPQLVKKDKIEKNNLQTKTLSGGVVVKDTKLGNGPLAKKGKTIQVYYSGKLKQNGKQFDSCTSGKPFRFRLGAGEVIRGWDIGFEDMKVGGKRTLEIPAPMAYGNKKIPGIPPNSTLIFDVELKAVN